MSVASLIAAAPAGDGHHVLVLPGFGGGDASTRPLRHALDRLGYAPHGWGQGINQGLRRDTLHSLHRRVAELSRPAVDGSASSAGASAACTP